MAETLSVILSYVLTFGIPTLVMGIGAMAGEKRVSTMLASVILITYLTYYNHTGVQPVWIMLLVFIFVALIFAIMFNSIFSGGGD